MIKLRTLRPHGNHNPQYGGQFFMAPDNTHHIEGALPRAGMFRLYVYDDYARPLPAVRMNAVQARVVTKETFDAATRTSREIAAFPLVKGGGGYLEARIDNATLPAQLTAKVKFKKDAPEYRFDFTFTELSKKPAAPAEPRSSRTISPSGRNAAKPGTATPAAPPAASAAEVNAPAAGAAAGAVESTPPSAPIPETVPEILAQLSARNAEIGDLVQRGAFAAVWVPAFRARDLSIALEGHLDGLPPAARDIADPAIKRLVRTAWLLDAFGDIGNRQQITEAYAIFAAAVDQVAAAFRR
jgi:hypothetical protein